MISSYKELLIAAEHAVKGKSEKPKTIQHKISLRPDPRPFRPPNSDVDGEVMCRNRPPQQETEVKQVIPEVRGALTIYNLNKLVPALTEEEEGLARMMHTDRWVEKTGANTRSPANVSMDDGIPNIEGKERASLTPITEDKSSSNVGIATQSQIDSAENVNRCTVSSTISDTVAIKGTAGQCQSHASIDIDDGRITNAEKKPAAPHLPLSLTRGKVSPTSAAVAIKNDSTTSPGHNLSGFGVAGNDNRGKVSSTVYAVKNEKTTRPSLNPTSTNVGIARNVIRGVAVNGAGGLLGLDATAVEIVQVSTVSTAVAIKYERTTSPIYGPTSDAIDTNIKNKSAVPLITGRNPSRGRGRRRGRGSTPVCNDFYQSRNGINHFIFSFPGKSCNFFSLSYLCLVNAVVKSQ
jgi:hypothetical protein